VISTLETSCNQLLSPFRQPPTSYKPCQTCSLMSVCQQWTFNDSPWLKSRWFQMVSNCSCWQRFIGQPVLFVNGTDCEWHPSNQTLQCPVVTIRCYQPVPQGTSSQLSLTVMVMVWGCISHDCKQDLVTIQGNLTGEQYIRDVLQLSSDQWILLHVLKFQPRRTKHHAKRDRQCRSANSERLMTLIDLSPADFRQFLTVLVDRRLLGSIGQTRAGFCFM
jgi:hypothetical protein